MHKAVAGAMEGSQEICTYYAKISAQTGIAPLQMRTGFANSCT